MTAKEYQDTVVASEFNEQIAVVEYLENNGFKFTSIPNSTYTPFKKEKYKNYVQGLRPGLPDLLIVCPKCLLFIEMKKIKTGKVTENQRAWIDALNKIINVKAEVCFGSEEAIAIIKKYVKSK